MSGDTSLGWTHEVANILGAAESGLRLVLGQLAGYPLLLLYRRHLANKDTNTQHLYFFLSGEHHPERRNTLTFPFQV